MLKSAFQFALHTRYTKINEDWNHVFNNNFSYHRPIFKNNIFWISTMSPNKFDVFILVRKIKSRWTTRSQSCMSLQIDLFVTVSSVWKGKILEVNNISSTPHGPHQINFISPQEIKNACACVCNVREKKLSLSTLKISVILSKIESILCC